MGMFDGGGIDIAGHKIPPAALAVGAGVIGLLVVMRMRSSGGGASVGAAPRPYSSSGGYDAMQAGNLNVLSSQVNSLANSVQALQAKPAPATTRTVAGKVGEPLLVVAQGPDGIWGPAGNLPGGLDIGGSMGTPVSAMWGTGTDAAGHWIPGATPFQAVPFVWGGKTYYTNAAGVTVK